MAKNKFYVTTPIYYVNDVPHIGHAYTTIAADVLARYHKLKGDDVYFLTGTDEHGAKIAEAAKKAGKDPKEFVDSLVPKFKDAWKNLDIDYTEFFRTTDPKHEKIVQEIVSKLQKKGYVEKRKYEGLYCVGCERFYKSEELNNGKCPDHDKECINHSEENYFFLLSKAVKDTELEKKIKSGEIEVAPESRKNEVLGKIKTGFEDVSISRENVPWGVKFPGDESQTVYVWVDALINYFSATKIYKDFDVWPADLHLMAKDILWFHAIIWPTILMVIEEAPPKKVFAHGFFTVGGQKMSKTIGNVLDPNYLVNKYGADAVRYALLREFPFGEDGDISEEKIALRYEKDLANGIGNLLNRALTMMNKYEIKVSRRTSNAKVLGATTASYIQGDIESLNFNNALNTIQSLVESGNEIIEREKPWELFKKNKIQKIGEVLSDVCWLLQDIAEYTYPFMPETSEKMKKQLKTLMPEPLFPRLEEK